MSNILENTLKKEMNNNERNTAFEVLLQHMKNNILSLGAINAAAIKF